MDLNDLIMSLEDEGYGIIEGLLSPAEATSLDQQARREMEPRDGYISLEGAINDIPDLAGICMHPVIMELAERVLGPDFFLANNVAMKWCKPGAPLGDLHGAGTQGDDKRISELQIFWLLTDFTVENGATHIIPFSKHAGYEPRRKRYPQEIQVLGKKGSVFVFDDRSWHQSGANTSKDQHRMAANMLYQPAAAERPPEGWPLVKRSLYNGFPPLLQRVLRKSVEPEGYVPGEGEENKMWNIAPKQPADA